MNSDAVSLVRRARGISLAARALLFDLALYASEDAQVHVGAKRLAEDLDSSDRHVRQMLHDLLVIGVLEVIQRGGGRGKATVYRFILRGNYGRIHSGKQ